MGRWSDLDIGATQNKRRSRNHGHRDVRRDHDRHNNSSSSDQLPFEFFRPLRCRNDHHRNHSRHMSSMNDVHQAFPVHERQNSNRPKLNNTLEAEEIMMDDHHGSCCGTNQLFLSGGRDHLFKFKQFTNDVVALSEEMEGNIVFVACGDEHVICQTRNHGLYVRGRNYEGQLGLRDFEDRNFFCKLRDRKINYHLIKWIACGKFCSALVDQLGNVWCSGEYGMVMYDHSSFYRVGCLLGNVTLVSMGNQCLFVLVNQCELYGCGRFTTPQDERHQLSLLNRCENSVLHKQNIAQLSCGNRHVCVLTEQGNNMYCSYIQPHQELVWHHVVFDSPVRQISCGSTFICVLTVNDELYGMGENVHGEFGFVGASMSPDDPFTKFVKVQTDVSDILHVHTTSSGHGTILETKSGQIYGAGFNGYFQLGLTDNIDRYKFDRIPFKRDGHPFLCIQPGCMFTAILTGYTTKSSPIFCEGPLEQRFMEFSDITIVTHK